MTKFLLSFGVIAFSLNIYAGQTRQLQCTAVMTADLKSGTLSGLQVRRELPTVSFTQKNGAALADAETVLTIQDALGFELFNIKATAFLYENQKLAGLSLSISNGDNQRVLASGSGLILLNKATDDSSSMSITAPLASPIDATFLRNDFELPSNTFEESQVTVITTYCNLR